jgi:ribosomal protein S6--L-glutamate ligase
VRVILDAKYRRSAIAATRVMGLEVAGVDMLETREGPKILEINSSPGLEGIERASGIDVAVAVVTHAERYLARRGQRRSKLTLDDERRLSRLRAGVVVPPPRRRAGMNGG